jgi:hypothetical protein
MNNLKLGKAVYYYFTSFMVLVCLTSIWGFYKIWKIGSVNVQNVAATLESSGKIEELKKRDDLAKISNLVLSDRHNDAISLIDNSYRNIKIIDAEGSPTFANLESDILQTKAELNNLVNFSRMSNVITTFAKKIYSFEEYVSNNNWKTLTRISERMHARTTPEQISRPDFYLFEKLTEYVKYTERDVLNMQKISDASVLSADKKQLIGEKLVAMRKDLSILSEYVVARGTFQNKFENFKKTYQVWVDYITPEVSLRKLEHEKTSRFFLYAVGGFIIAITFGIFGGRLVYQRSLAQTQRYLEEGIISTIRDSLIPLDHKLNFNASDRFNSELQQCKDYIHKRMSYGAVFQEAMPFSSILLDSNLNILWANKHFYEQWDLTDLAEKNENITWDYLQRFTNLGEIDPVATAVKDRSSGTFQIQVRTKQSKDTVSYEMYVSPVEYGGQNRLMVVFYPLRTIEESIYKLTRSLVGPVARTLDSLNSGQFTKEFREKIEKDFNVANISDIYHRFIDYHQKQSLQTNGLMQEIERMEIALADNFRTLNESVRIQQIIADHSQNTIQEFKATKDGVIECVNDREYCLQTIDAIDDISRQSFSIELDLVISATQMNETIGQCSKSMNAISKLRQELKELKVNLNDGRIRLSQTLEQVFIFPQSEDQRPSKVESVLDKIKNEIRTLEKSLEYLTQGLVSLDVNLSKSTLLIERYKSPELAVWKETLMHNREKVNALTQELQAFRRLTGDRDEALVAHLSTAFKELKDLREQGKKLMNETKGAYQEIIVKGIVNRPPTLMT